MYILGNDAFSNALLSKLKNVIGKVKIKNNKFWCEGEKVKENPNNIFVLAVKNLEKRKEYLKIAFNIGYTDENFPNVIAEHSIVLPRLDDCYGNIFLPFTMVDSNTKLGNFNLLDSYSSIYSSTHLGNHNILDAYASIENSCKIGDENRIRSGGKVTENLKIDNNNIVHEGEVLYDNMTSNMKFVHGVLYER